MPTFRPWDTQAFATVARGPLCPAAMTTIAPAPAPKPWIMGIAPYTPGRSTTDDGRTVIKLSSNENPLGTSPAAVAAFADAATSLERYPDAGATALREAIAANPPPMHAGRLPRVLFATQASTRPPRFVLFASGFIEAGYRRFVERRIREEFGFEGTPIEVSVRVREKRSRR